MYTDWIETSLYLHVHQAHGRPDPRVPRSDILQHINEAPDLPRLLRGRGTKYTKKYMFTDDTTVLHMLMIFVLFIGSLTCHNNLKTVLVSVSE